MLTGHTRASLSVLGYNRCFAAGTGSTLLLSALIASHVLSSLLLFIQVSACPVAAGRGLDQWLLLHLQQPDGFSECDGCGSQCHQRGVHRAKLAHGSGHSRDHNDCGHGALCQPDALRVLPGKQTNLGMIHSRHGMTR